MKVEKQEVTQKEGGEETVQAKPSRKDHYMEKHPDFTVLNCGMDKDTGINYNRGCTDFLCVVFFLVFVSTMFGTAFYGLIKGHPKAMIKPYDFTNKFCGINDTTKEYGKLFLSDLAPKWPQGDFEPAPTQIAYKMFYQEAVCVKACPKKGEKPQCPQNYRDPDTGVNYDYDYKCNSVATAGTVSMMDVCWPHWDDMSAEEKDNWDIIMIQLKKNVVYMQFMNLYTAWKAILTSLATAFLLCIIYIYFMSIFAEYVAWGIIFLTQFGFIALTAGSFYYYTTVSDDGQKSLAILLGIIGAILSILFCLALWCGWHQLRLAIEIVNASADFLAQTKRVLAVPVLYYVFLLMFFLFYMSCNISVRSMGKIEPNPDGGLAYIPLKRKVTWGDRKEAGTTANWMLAFLTFGLLWFTFFLQASSNYVVMVTAATYYFTSNKEVYGSGQLKTGLRWAWVHNFGSLAFGSLIVAIIFTIRVIVYTICKKAETASGDNGFVKCISCLVRCLLKCIEEIVEYINRAAYAFMAIAGQGFCSSAYNGLLLQFKHGAKFTFANYLAFVFILLGKVGITVLNIFLAWLFMKHVSKSANQVSNPYGPLIIIGVFSYLVVSTFLGLFDESVMAMMTSACADMDIHGGDPMWGPKTLHDVLDDLDGDDGDAEKK